jgi:hypothetical protein
MYQKDYILRMIEMLGDLIAGILGLIRKGEFIKAEQSLENLYIDFLKQDASFFQNIPKEELTGKLLQEHNYTNSHLEILAELFNTQAELLSAKGNQKESLTYYEKSLLLFEFLENESNIFSLEKQTKISTIRKKLIIEG